MRWLDDLCQDARYALRTFRRNPGVVLVAILTLALGVGASTAVFTVIDSVLLRPLRLADPARLLMIAPTSHARLSQAYVSEWRQRSTAFQQIAGWYDVHAELGGAAPLDVWVDRVTSNFFATLGVRPIVGRTFEIETESSPPAREVVLSYGLWQRRYGGEPAVVGRSVELDGEALTIVGVMPRGFTVRTTELSESHADMWTPIRLDTRNRVGMGGILNVVGRLAPGATLASARAELAEIARGLEQAFSSYSRDWGVEVTLLQEATVRVVRPSLLVLFGATGILLLIACANVANLLLSRAAVRRAELATRMSLGATRLRLVRQLLTESLLLALLGGALGTVVAIWGTARVVAMIPEGLDFPRAQDVGVDTRLLVFALGVMLLNAALFGAVPAISSARSASVQQRPSSRSGGWKGLNAIVQLEVALALVLLVGAGLLMRSFWKLSASDPGFRADRVLTVRLSLPANRYDTDQRLRSFGAELLERVAVVPGVQIAGTINYVPMSRIGSAQLFDIQGRPPARAGDRPSSWVNVVGGRYFEAMGIPLRRGRLPGANDTDRSRPVFVIDEELARRFWPQQNPIGAELVWPGPRNTSVSGEVVAVVGGVRWTGMAAERNPTTYFWFPQNPGRQLTLVIRTAGDPLETARPVADAIAAVDPRLPIASMRPMSDFVSDDLSRPRAVMLCLAVFAAAALFLSAIGLYGVTAFGVAQRRYEIGVRIALGAQRRDVFWLVMRRVLRLTLSGMACGVVLALGTGRLITGLLYGIEPSDVETLIAAVLFLAFVGFAAGFLPARRAVRVDPIELLRAD